MKFHITRFCIVFLIKWNQSLIVDERIFHLWRQNIVKIDVVHVYIWIIKPNTHIDIPIGILEQNTYILPFQGCYLYEILLIYEVFYVILFYKIYIILPLGRNETDIL